MVVIVQRRGGLALVSVLVDVVIDLVGECLRVSLDCIMHECLRLEEILHEIFSQADYRSLTIFARTCRLFYEPALNAIYSDLSSIEPLIERLPQDLWSRNSGVLVSAQIKVEDFLVTTLLSRLFGDPCALRIGRSLRVILAAFAVYDLDGSRAMSSFIVPSRRHLTPHSFCLTFVHSIGIV